jgi:hypothetical protein
MHNSDSLEDNLRLPFRDNDDAPSTNVEYLAKPENYSGSDLHSIRLQLFAQNKLHPDGDAGPGDQLPVNKQPSTTKPRLSLRRRDSGSESLTSGLLPLHVQLVTLHKNRKLSAHVRRTSTNLSLIEDNGNKRSVTTLPEDATVQFPTSTPSQDTPLSSTRGSGGRRRMSEAGPHRESVSESAWAPPQLTAGHRVSTTTTPTSEQHTTRVRRFTRTSAPFVPAFAVS